jgi:hypothetical protein
MCLTNNIPRQVGNEISLFNLLIRETKNRNCRVPVRIETDCHLNIFTLEHLLGM